MEPGTSPRTLLRKLVRGRRLCAASLWWRLTFRQLDALAKAEQLKPQTQGMTSDAIMQALGMPGLAAEGRFFPDTYTYSKGSPDLAVLKRAARAMDKKLAWAWEQRSPQTPLQTPEQALILASIVEKETGRSADRTMVSSVFNNRLRIGMRLQTDPTVIYGLGDSFDGNLRKKDLLTDTPWNTYICAGSPTPPLRSARLTPACSPPSKALYL